MTWVGRSAWSTRMRQQLPRLASAKIDVLLVGETGTGKEVLARLLHDTSHRGGPFVGVNVAALAPTLIPSELFGHVRGAFTGADKDHDGAFLRAHGGTLFLDEIGDLPLHEQSILLRVLEERAVVRVGGGSPQPVDIRLISAAPADLFARIDGGRVGRDLYFRIASGAVIEIPPLRERREDVREILDLCVARALFPSRRSTPYADVTGVMLLEAQTRLREWLTEAAIRFLVDDHRWPGNAREVQALANQLVHLPPERPLNVAEILERLPGSRLMREARPAEQRAEVRVEPGVEQVVKRYAQLIAVYDLVLLGCPGTLAGRRVRARLGDTPQASTLEDDIEAALETDRIFGWNLEDVEGWCALTKESIAGLREAFSIDKEPASTLSFDACLATALSCDGIPEHDASSLARAGVTSLRNEAAKRVPDGALRAQRLWAMWHEDYDSGHILIAQEKGLANTQVPAAYGKRTTLWIAAQRMARRPGRTVAERTDLPGLGEVLERVRRRPAALGDALDTWFPCADFSPDQLFPVTEETPKADQLSDLSSAARSTLAEYIAQRRGSAWCGGHEPQVPPVPAHVFNGRKAALVRCDGGWQFVPMDYLVEIARAIAGRPQSGDVETRQRAAHYLSVSFCVVTRDGMVVLQRRTRDTAMQASKGATRQRLAAGGGGVDWSDVGRGAAAGTVASYRDVVVRAARRELRAEYPFLVQGSDGVALIGAVFCGLEPAALDAVVRFDVGLTADEFEAKHKEYLRARRERERSLDGPSEVFEYEGCEFVPFETLRVAAGSGTWHAPSGRRPLRTRDARAEEARLPVATSLTDSVFSLLSVLRARDRDPHQGSFRTARSIPR